MKDGCVLARIAEDKFIIVMPIAETIAQVMDCANEITDAFVNPILPADSIGSLFVTTIVGVATFPEDGRDATPF